MSGDSEGNEHANIGAESDKPNLTDPRAIRALAHPARLAILDYLGERESATATECADIVGLSPSATSYHLRELARYGLVQEAPGIDRRERRWRSSGGWRVDDNAGTDPAARAATQLLAPLVLARGDEQARRFFAAAPHADPEWWNAANFAESRMRLTLDELRELARATVELVESFARRYPLKSRTGDPDAREVLLEIRAFPVPGPDGARAGSDGAGDDGPGNDGAGHDGATDDRASHGGAAGARATDARTSGGEATDT